MYVRVFFSSLFRALHTREYSHQGTLAKTERSEMDRQTGTHARGPESPHLRRTRGGKAAGAAAGAGAQGGVPTSTPTSTPTTSLSRRLSRRLSLAAQAVEGLAALLPRRSTNSRTHSRHCSGSRSRCAVHLNPSPPPPHTPMVLSFLAERMHRSVTSTPMPRLVGSSRPKSPKI